MATLGVRRGQAQAAREHLGSLCVSVCISI
jgi:hypothetical protein